MAQQPTSASGALDTGLFKTGECPNSGETYTTGTGSLGTRSGVSNRHHVQASKNVIVRDDGSLALKLSAKCDCGWSKSTVIDND